MTRARWAWLAALIAALLLGSGFGHHDPDPTPAPSSTASATPTATPIPSATPTSTPTPAPDPSAMPVGDVTSDGVTWHQTLAQDFTTPAAVGDVQSAYPTMGYYDGFTDTSGHGLYAPSKVLSVHDGYLDFAVHSEDGQPLVAAVMPDGYAPHSTVRVSIRYRTTATPGYKFVGLLWPSSNEWNQGEIDWPEADLGGAPRPASAIPGSFSNGGMTFLPSTQQFAPTDSTGWHTATTEWTPTGVRWFWDGQLVASTTQAVPTEPMRVTLQAETSIGEGPVPADASGHVDIDWVSIWSE